MSDPIEFDPIGDTIAELSAQIPKIQAAIDVLESVRPFMSKRSSGVNPRGNSEPSFGHNAFFGMTGADAAKKYLAAIKKTASAEVIADALIAGGWKTSSKNVPRTCEPFSTAIFSLLLSMVNLDWPNGIQAAVEGERLGGPPKTSQRKNLQLNR